MFFLFSLAISDSVYAVNWPLKICGSGANGYLCDQDNIPFLVAGDTAWSAAVELDSTPLAGSDLLTYLNDREARGFTAIIVNAIDIAFGGPNNTDGEHPFNGGNSDWSSPNSKYWDDLDTLLNEAKKRDIVVFLFPAYIGYNCGSEGWCSNMLSQSNADMTDYGEFLGNRYATQGNIVWVAGGDYDCIDTANLCDRVFAIHTGIHGSNGDNGYHLHTAHGGGDPAMYSYNESWLDINTEYTAVNLAVGIQTEYERSDAKPLNYIEGYYENEYSTTEVVWQRQALFAYLGGALVGHFFGNCPIWHFDQSQSFCDNGTYKWADRLGATGSVTMSNIGKLMKSREWWKLRPDYSNTVVTSGKGSGESYHATARSSNGETVMVWCPNANTVTVDMTKISGTQAIAWWYDPDNNSAQEIGSYETKGERSFTPTKGRMVLIIDDLSLNLPAPGSKPYSDIQPPNPIATNAILLLF